MCICFILFYFFIFVSFYCKVYARVEVKHHICFDWPNSRHGTIAFVSFWFRFEFVFS